MRKKLFFLSCSLLLSSLFYSCKEEEASPNPSQSLEIATQNATTHAATNNVISWLGDQKALAKPRLKEHLELLTANLELFKTKTEEFNKEDDLIIIPLNKKYNKSKGIDERSQNNLVVLAARSGEIKGARIIEFTPEPGNNLVESPASIVKKIFYKQFPGVNGTFSLSRLSGHLYSEVTYKNDKLFSSGVIQKGPADSVSRREPVYDCTNWYLYEAWYDENGNLINWRTTYLYTTCEELDGGGGDGGGEGEGEVWWVPGECDMTVQDAQAALASITSTISSDGISETGAASAPNENGIIERPVVVKRHRLKYTFPGGRTATYTLYFPGKLFQTTTNSQWKWKELAFSHIGLSEGDPGPCFTVEFSPAISLTIDDDKLNARFVAEITAKLKAACAGSILLRTKGESLNGVYPSSDF